MAHSALDTAKSETEVEVLLGVDLDDPDRADYADIEDVKMFAFGPGLTVSEIWNELALQCSGDLLMMGNDDLSFLSLDWDERFREAARQYPDGVFVAWADDGINGGSHCAFPCVSRAWYEALGYFAPTVGFRFFRNDTWVYDIGRRLGRCHFMEGVSIRHEHHSVGGVRDATTMRNRSSNQSVIDARIWAETDGVRAADAEKLRARMNQEVA